MFTYGETFYWLSCMLCKIKHTLYSLKRMINLISEGLPCPHMSSVVTEAGARGRDKYLHPTDI